MKYFTNEVKIALAAIIGVVILYVGLQFLKGTSLFSNQYTYYVRFSDVNGLSTSSPVYGRGIKIGVVESINYSYDRPEEIIVAIGVNKKALIPQGTAAEISSDLLGNVKLELVYGPDFSKALSVGDTISGSIQQGLMSKAAGMMPQIEQMLPKLDSILMNINTIVADPALAGTLHNAEQLTASLTSTSNQIRQLTVSLGKEVPGMMQKANGVLDNTEKLTRQLSEVDVQTLVNRVDETLANVQQLSAALSSDKGTLGQLMYNPELYTNLTETMDALDVLLRDFKEHPKRYINVSVFGRKGD